MSWVVLLITITSFVASVGAQTVIDVKRVFYLDKQEDVKGGYIAAIVLLSLAAVGLTAILVALGVSNQRYFATKALESEDDDDDDEEMHNVLEGGEDGEETDEEDGSGDDEAH